MRHGPPRQDAAGRLGETVNALHRPEGQRLCIIGSGAISERVTSLLAARSDAGLTLVGIATQPGVRRCGWWPEECRQITNPDDLASLSPDIIVEAAGRDAVREWGEAALKAARMLVVCSVSALTHDALRDRLTAIAAAAGSQLVIGHGALGGIQAISAAALRPLKQVTHVIRKPPLAWRGTVAEGLIDLSGLREAVTFFRGTAREAASTYPANANAVATTALASIGLDRTEVALVADPNVDKNVHELFATGDFGSLSLRLANEPMPSNPKTSDMTALTITHLLLGRTAALVV
jgi:Predicted dinucleotide-utilizing enzyme